MSIKKKQAPIYPKRKLKKKKKKMRKDFIHLESLNIEMSLGYKKCAELANA